MTSRSALYLVGGLIVLALGGYFLMNRDTSVQNVTLSGTYLCLPHADPSSKGEGCVFGLKTDDGTHYAVNFGASMAAFEQFESGAHITADGFIEPKETLDSPEWDTYIMEGIFTVTEMH